MLPAEFWSKSKTIFKNLVNKHNRKGQNTVYTCLFVLVVAIGVDIMAAVVHLVRNANRIVTDIHMFYSWLPEKKDFYPKELRNVRRLMERIRIATFRGSKRRILIGRAKQPRYSEW